GAETVAAFIAEPIGGSSSGAMVPRRGYWDEVAAICRRHEVLLIADEVLCGMGRTGRMFACEHFDLLPDILVLGKGLNAGALPLSAVLARRGLVELLAAGSGAFNHAQTYSHHPALCAAGLATLRALVAERLVERVARLEAPFLGGLERLREHRQVGDVRGRGFLAALEFVADRETKRPFDRKLHFAERFTERAFANGLIVWPNAGNVDGTNGDLVLLAPPFTATEDELAEIVHRLDRTLLEMT
ncbi:MAG: aminotransferase class III-fold pyridoxal phosphate-dependent enzyme, partial [Thermoanaerobaculia bacterium]